MLTSYIGDKQYIASADLDRSLDFKCPSCQGSTILRAGLVKIAHFAHKANANCPYSEGETKAHLFAKRAIYEKLLDEGAKDVFLEFRFEDGERIADVLFHHPTLDIFVAVELQHSPIDEMNIWLRTKSYTNKGVYVIWISVHDFETDRENKICERHKVWHKMHNSVLFHMHPFQDYYSYRCNHVTKEPFSPTMVEGLNKARASALCASHFEPATRYVPASDWGGGYHKALKSSRNFSSYELNLLELAYVKNRDQQLVGCVNYNDRWW